MSTHYVVTRYGIRLNLSHSDLPLALHGDYAWLQPADLVVDPDVDEHSKWYFIKDKTYS